MTQDPKYITYSIGEEWTALYVDGVLDRVGDTYLIHERVYDYLGVDQRTSEVMDETVRYYSDVPETTADLYRLEQAKAEEAKQERIRRAEEAVKEAQRVLEEELNTP